jgi:branched-chain amino acid transport system substrate-binding protein
VKSRHPSPRLRGRVHLLLSLTAVALMIAACGGGSTGGSSGSKSPYTIPFVGDLTGGDAANGLGGQAGFNTAVKEINDAGGINGHKITVQAFDSQSDPAAFSAQLRQALALNPVAMVTHQLSSETAAAVSIFQSANVPVVTPSYTITGVDTIPYWLSTSPLAAGVGIGTANGLKVLLGGSLSGKKIAFEGLTSPAVDGNLAALKAQVDAGGGTMGMVVRDPVTFSSWSSQAANMAASKPDAVVLNNTDGNNATVVKALLVAGLTAPVLAAEGANSDTMLAAANSANFYTVREHVPPASGSTLYKDATAAGATPDQIGESYFAKDYAALWTIAQTLTKCGDSCSTSKFVSTLHSLGRFTIPNDALAGQVDFSKSNSGLTTAKVWAWDPTNKKSVEKGAAFTIV